MTILGPCRHRYSLDTRCGLTVLATPYGPGHASPPKAAHYPVISTSTPGPILPDVEVAAGPRVRRSSPELTAG